MIRGHVIFLVVAFGFSYSNTQAAEGFAVYNNTLKGSQQISSSNVDQLPLTCLDVNSSQPRVVTILRDGLEVLCDTQTDGGGWIVIQRRVTGTVDFYRNWEEYKYGFGDINGEFWFGNEKVHRLTFQRRYELRVDLKFRNHDFNASYSHFRLFGEPERYRLKVWGYSGNAGDSLADQNNQRFSTYDRDYDVWASNCASSFHGAWWYKSCHTSNLNGLWGSRDFAEGLSWYSLTTYYDSAHFTEMKIRPVY